MRKQMRNVFACLLALVMIVSMIPGVSFAASKKACIVTNQKQLQQALKSGKKDIQVKTAKKVKLTIPALKQAKSATITINAKNAIVTNKASVKSVVIKDANTFVESGKNNTIRISDKKLSLTVTTQSKGAKFKVVSKSDLTVSGTAKEPVKITVTAKNTTIKAKEKIDVTLNADAALTFAAGAEGSRITTTKNVTANVVNNAKGIVVMKDSTGIPTNIAAGEKQSVTDKYPKVDFSKSDDVLTGNVSFERNELLLTVKFYSDEQVIDKNGKKLDDWTVDVGLFGEAGDKFCLDTENLEFSGENDETVTAIFEIFEDTVGKHSMQFDYELYADDAETQFLGKKTFTVNYEIAQDDLDKLNASYKGKVTVTGKDTLYADFSAANPSGNTWISIKKQGGDTIQWAASKNIWDVEDEPYQYEIELEKELEDGAYIVIASYPDQQNAQYLGKFTYDSSAWTNLEKAKDIVESATENLNLWDDSFNTDALKTELLNKIRSGIKDEQIQIDVKRWVTEEGDDVFLQVDIQKGDMVCRVRQTDWV